MKNKICIYKNAKQTKILKYFNMTFISKTIKLIIMCAMAICVWTFMIFHITYMSHYKFFSYDLLSFNNIWLFAYVFLSTIIFGILTIPFNMIYFYCKHIKKKVFWFIVLSLSLLAVVFMPLVLFFIIMWFAYFVLIESCVDFYNNRKLNGLVLPLLVVLVIIVLIAFSCSEPFNNGFKMFLTNKSLAADKVEIYLKDKNQFVIGKMVFRDSKFAYVIYDDINSSNNSADSKGQYRANKLVPIENVTILNPLPQDSTLQK